VNRISIGKYWGLQRCATAQGTLAVLALDHRRSLRKALGTSSTERVSDIEMSVFKQQVVNTLAPAASAILLDPEVGALQCIASGTLPGNVGLIVAQEASGYAGKATARESGLLPGWSVEKAKRIGASGIKLLVYYHPDSSTANDVEELVRQVDEVCAEQDMAFFLEPLTYSLHPNEPLRGDERRWVITETARRLTNIGGDVLKAEFPIDSTTHPDARDWAAACATLSEVSRVPWVLLSASVDFDTYLRQVTVACQEGASGVMVGRAVWKEATALTGDARQRFLTGTAFTRMQRITALCNALARPWTTLYQPTEITSKSYQTY
jgi:tagatose-1,6-bisphosphate aldolase